MGKSKRRPLRVFFPGISATPQTFLRGKFQMLERSGIEVVRRSFPRNSLPLPRPHVVHFEWNSAAAAALSQRRTWDIPVVVSCRGTQIRVRPHVSDGYAAPLRETFTRAASVHCVCEAIRAEAIALGADPRKTVVIYPGVDVNEFQPATHEPHQGPLRLLSVGTLIWTKGYEYALSSLKQLTERGIEARLEIIGGGSDLQRVRFTARELGLDEHVWLRGEQPPAEVRRALGRTDVFLHSSLSEGISNAVLEAMASAIPIVSSDSGGMGEAVTDGREGYLIPTRAPGAAADALEQLARSPALRSQMGDAGRATVLAKFRLENQVDEFISLYEDISGLSVARERESSLAAGR